MKGYNRTSFEAVHQSGRQVTSIRLNPLRVAAVDAETGATDNEELPAALRLLTKDTAITASPIPWTTSGYYLSERPSFTFDPALPAMPTMYRRPAACSSSRALKQTTDLRKDIRVLDLCAAPGGKSFPVAIAHYR